MHTRHRWDPEPTYESERIRIDATLSPLVFFDMKLPRLVQEGEVDRMLALADSHLTQSRPFLGLVQHHRGTGVISSSVRRKFSEWLEARRHELDRDDVAVVVVMPEAIFRAVLRVVYRFRVPPLRTITTSDVGSAIESVRAELTRMGRPITPSIEAFLEGLRAAAPSAST